MQIREVVAKYFEGLAKKDFDIIPYAQGVRLRAPLTPEGMNKPLVGLDTVRSGWWQPLPSLLGSVTLNRIYFDEELTGAVATGEVEILLDPPVILSVADRFTIDDRGRIVEQDNHFDPREVTSRL